MSWSNSSEGAIRQVDEALVAVSRNSDLSPCPSIVLTPSITQSTPNRVASAALFIAATTNSLSSSERLLYQSDRRPSSGEGFFPDGRSNCETQPDTAASRHSVRNASTKSIGRIFLHFYVETTVTWNFHSLYNSSIMSYEFRDLTWHTKSLRTTAFGMLL